MREAQGVCGRTHRLGNPTGKRQRRVCTTTLEVGDVSKVPNNQGSEDLQSNGTPLGIWVSQREPKTCSTVPAQVLWDRALALARPPSSFPLLLPECPDVNTARHPVPARRGFDRLHPEPPQTPWTAGHAAASVSPFPSSHQLGWSDTSNLHSPSWPVVSITARRGLALPGWSAIRRGFAAQHGHTGTQSRSGKRWHCRNMLNWSRLHPCLCTFGAATAH